ncbi:MAG: ABC transporter ATP-binding protein [Methyloceanibacter sp.]|nr:ABC transporter ATP-binding protein [Methyloceanibacter sp.]
MNKNTTNNHDRRQNILKNILQILQPEKKFYGLAIVYGVAISLFSLATPISVQMLINTVANTAMTAPLVLLSLTLFVLLMTAGLLNALRIHLMEIFSRRFYSRVVAEIALRALFARDPFFDDDRRTALFNRYFDIIIVQKTLPTLLIGGFTLVLQAGVGFALVSTYHPILLVFNLVLIALLVAVWLFWGRRAEVAAIDLSHQKHEMAAWLQSLAGSNGFFKTRQHINYALDQTEAATERYINEHRSYFREHFSQAISFLFLYAAASAVLLGLGGWLVIQGQLSLGQLVAAELVLSAVFFGISQLSYYLVYYYDMCAAIDELSLILDVEIEDSRGETQSITSDSSLAFVNVRGKARGIPARLDFMVGSGTAVMAAVASHGVQRLVVELLKRRITPDVGYVALGNVDISEFAPSLLHEEVVLLDRPTVIEMTIREYLLLSGEDVSPVRLQEVLMLVGLDTVITQLEDGLDTSLASSGWPLSFTETMSLKLAGAILARPKLIVLNQLYDLVAEENISRAIRHLKADECCTVLYFTRRQRNVGFDTFLYLDHEEQLTFRDFEDFLIASHGPEVAQTERTSRPQTKAMLAASEST